MVSISISIEHSLKELFDAIVFLNGYKLTITRSIKLILFFFNSFKCLGTFLFASIPPCIFGCRVFILPSRISGEFVYFDISITFILFVFN